MLTRLAQEICDITNGIIGHHVLITDENKGEFAVGIIFAPKQFHTQNLGIKLKRFI